jgi:hypothetical protein
MTMDDLQTRISSITLRSGAHRTAEQGMCAMEAVAWLKGEPFSDRPQCTCPVIAAFVRRWNDRLPSDNERTRLLGPLLASLLDTRGSLALARRRAFVAADWCVRQSTPMLLRALGREAQATALESCAPLVEVASSRAAREVSVLVRDEMLAAADADDADACVAYAAAYAAYAADADAYADAAYAADAYDADASAAADLWEKRRVAIRDALVSALRRVCQVRS